MNTYFCRHGADLDLSPETYKRLWEDDIIAIHYPWDKSDKGNSAPSDCRSLDPDDYDGAAKSCLKAMHKLAANGGYVCAVYDPFPGCTIGYVSPGSEVSMFHGKWGHKNERSGREALLKSIPLTKARNIGRTDSIALLAARPRQGTFCQWHMAKGKVQALVEDEPWMTSIDRLGTAQQEVLCSEVLRLKRVTSFGLPRLRALLLPVGRTLKGVDIVGIDHKGNHVIAQVTNHHLESAPARRKLDLLSEYEAVDGHRIMFCNANDVTTISNVVVFPLKKAFSLWKDSDAGVRWLEA